MTHAELMGLVRQVGALATLGLILACVGSLVRDRYPRCGGALILCGVVLLAYAQFHLIGWI